MRPMVQPSSPPNPAQDLRALAGWLDSYTCPERYAAKGDGVADDTGPLRECLAEAAGRIVWLAGRYRFRAPLDLHMRRVHARMVNGAGLLADNRDGGFEEAGYAVKIGNNSVAFANSYLTEFRDLWLNMNDAPGIDGIVARGTVGEHTRLCRVTVSNFRRREGQERLVRGLAFETFVQGLEINHLWCFSKKGDGRGTLGLALPKGRACVVANYTIMAEVAVEVEGDGVNLLAGHIEGVGEDAVGLHVVSRGSGSWQENPDPVVCVSGLNFRGLPRGAVVIEPAAAAVDLRGLCKLVAKPGEREEFFPSVVDRGRQPAAISCSRSIASYSRQYGRVLTTDPALAD